MKSFVEVLSEPSQQELVWILTFKVLLLCFLDARSGVNWDINF